MVGETIPRKGESTDIKLFELPHSIIEKRPQSLYQIAGLMNRDLKNANRELALLEGLNLKESLFKFITASYSRRFSISLISVVGALQVLPRQT